MCGSLLYGERDSVAFSTKRTGPPMNRDGEEVLDDDGSVNTDAQPPFLLRFSPALFAREIPAVFRHDPDTNCLSLKEGVTAPWLRGPCRKDNGHTWLYCDNCYDRYCKKGPQSTCSVSGPSLSMFHASDP